MTEGGYRLGPRKTWTRRRHPDHLCGGRDSGSGRGRYDGTIHRPAGGHGIAWSPAGGWFRHPAAALAPHRHPLRAPAMATPGHGALRPDRLRAAALRLAIRTHELAVDLRLGHRGH